MPPTQEPPNDPSDAARGRQAYEDRALARGSLINALGVVGKALTPVYLIVAIRMYGVEVAGLYYAAWVVLEVAVNFVVAGLDSGTTLFASRFLEQEDEEQLYRVLANAFLAGLAASGLCIGFAFVGGATILEGAWRPGYVQGLQILSLGLPFMVIPAVVVGATRAHLTMTWAALLKGILPPILLIAFAVGFRLAGFGLEGLLYGHVLAFATVTAVALVAFGRHFSYGRMVRALLRVRPFRPLFSFAIPQSLNMTFNTLITNVDVMMLTWLGYRPEQILFYGVGAQVVRQIRQVKVSITGAYGPLIARHHARGDLDSMNRSFAKVSRWAASLAVPLVLLVALLRRDIVSLFHGDFREDPVFMLVLLGLPLLSCTFGTAGNIVAMTGHSMWNLVNSIVVAALNLLLNYLMIPHWGLMGAAAASVAASAAITAIQLVEARRLEGARLDLRQVWAPYGAALLPAMGVLAASQLGWTTTLAGRIAVGAAALAGYGLGLWLLRRRGGAAGATDGEEKT